MRETEPGNTEERKEEEIELEGGVKLPKNLALRIVSAVVMIPVALLFLWMGGWWFTFLVTGIAGLMGCEWKGMVLSSEKVRVSVKQIQKWTLLGVCYIAIPCASIIALREESNGFYLVLWLFLVVWATDIFAYACGRVVGGPKLAPSISPKKTWAGLIGGVGAAMLVGMFSGLYTTQTSVITLIFLAGFVAVVSQIGDLLESAIKRYFDTKDSGGIIPGHGGVMDRVDGLTTAAPLVLVLNSMFGLF